MTRVRMRTVIKTAIISAFTFAAALIWKDVIIEIIELLVPPSEEIFYKLLTAIIATIMAIIAIIIVLETEEEAERVVSKMKHKDKKKRHYLKRNVRYID